jgi:hypothetical protein
MRVTIIPDDKTVVVNGIAYALPAVPLIDANVHAVQFFPESGHVTVEKKIGEREHLAGETAATLVRPFIEAYLSQVARVKSEVDAAAAKRAAEEQEIADRHARIRAELKAADAAVRAVEARQAETYTATQAPSGNMISSGTQVI